MVNSRTRSLFSWTNAEELTVSNDNMVSNASILLNETLVIKAARYIQAVCFLTEKSHMIQT